MERCARFTPAHPQESPDECPDHDEQPVVAAYPSAADTGAPRPTIWLSLCRAANQWQPDQYACHDCSPHKDRGEQRDAE